MIIDPEFLDVLGIPMPNYLEYKVSVQTPCGTISNIEGIVFIPECEIDDDIYKILISPNPSLGTDITVRIQTTRNTPIIGQLYVRNNNNIVLIAENYSTANPPITISSDMFTGGSNYIVFTDHHSFEVSEKLINLK